MAHSDFASECLSHYGRFKEAVRVQAPLQDVIDSVTDSVFVKDASGQILYTNDAYDKLFAGSIKPVGRSGETYLDDTVKPVSQLSDSLILSGSMWLQFSHVGIDSTGRMLQLLTFKACLLGLGQPPLAIFGISRVVSVVEGETPERRMSLSASWEVFRDLDARDQRIGVLLGRGAKIAAISAEVKVSERTVENRRRVILKALTLDRTHDLITLLVRLQEHGFCDFGI